MLICQNELDQRAKSSISRFENLVDLRDTHGFDKESGEDWGIDHAASSQGVCMQEIPVVVGSISFSFK